MRVGVGGWFCMIHMPQYRRSCSHVSLAGNVVSRYVIITRGASCTTLDICPIHPVGVKYALPLALNASRLRRTPPVCVEHSLLVFELPEHV